MKGRNAVLCDTIVIHINNHRGLLCIRPIHIAVHISSTFNNTLYSIQKRLVFLFCIVSALVSASLWSMTASAAAPVALSHILTVHTYAGGGNGDDSTSDGDSTKTARFNVPTGLRVAPDGRLFVTDSARLRVVSADGRTVSTYAGGGSVDVDSASTSNIRFRSLQDVAIHPDGRVFVLDGGFSSGHRVYVIDPTGSTASVYAGGGLIGELAGSFADGVSTTTARFNRPLGMALRSDGRLFIADTENHRIRVISADGATVSTYAGNGNPGLVDGDADAVEFNGPVSLAFATDGRLFVGDGNNRRIRVISADGNTVSTYAGRGATGETALGLPFPPADSIDFFDVAYIAITTDGRIIVSDDGSHNIRVISADGSRVSVYAGANGVIPGNRRPGFGTNPLNEGPAAEAGFRDPQGIAIDATGRVFVANRDFNLVSVIAPSLAVADIPPAQLSAAQQVRGASLFSAGVVQSLFSDADGSTLSYSLVETSSATAVSFAIDSISGAITYLQPTEALANTQTLVIAASDEQGTATSRLTVFSEPLSNYPPQFRLSTSALTRAEGFADPITITINDPDDGDTDGIEQPITYSLRIDPNDLLAPFATFAIDPQSGTITITSISGVGAFGNITVRVIADDGSNSHSESEQSFALTVTQVNNTPPVVVPSLRIVRTYAGSGVNDFADGSALTAQFNAPGGIARAADGSLFVADELNHRIRVISADGATVSTYAGDGVQSFADGSTSTARFSAPSGIAVAADGRLFVADERNHRIRVISADGATVSTYAGEGVSAFADGSTSTARFVFPSGVALAADGRLFVADTFNHRIRVISTDGATVSTYAGSGSGFANGSTSTARFNTPSGVALAADGRVFVADARNQRIRVISADGATVSTYAGDGVEGFADGSTTTARFDSPTDLVVASDGRVFVADSFNHRIRVISADGASVSTYAGSGAIAQTNEPQESQAVLDIDLSAPQRMTLTPDGRLFFTDTDSHRIRVIEVVSSTSENFASVALGAGFQRAGTRVIGAQNLFFDAEANDLTFSILSGNEDGLFAIDAASGRVTLAGSLTDTQAGTNTLVIQAQDLAGSATVTLTIVVEEVNQAPTFALSSSTLELDEDFGTNTDIVVVNPDDGDAAIEQTLTYGISPASIDFATLAIDAQSGAVTITSIADGFGSAVITVTVDDASATNNVATQTFTLTVNEVNDPPVFALSTAVLTLNEDFGTNTGISVVSANDGDNGDQVITYRINPTNTGFATLAIDAQTGEVTITSVANGFGSAVITVIAEDDGGGDTNQSTQTFMLTVLDVVDSVLAQRISVYAGQIGVNALVNGSSSTARFDTPKGLALRADGSLLIVDSGNNVIRLISADGATVSTYPDSSATSTFNQLADIAATVDGRVFVADSGARQILVISADGSTISVYAGSGVAGSENGNSLATAQFSEPVSLAVAEDGRLFIGDVGNNQIRVINANGSAVSTYFDGEGQFVPNDISIAADGRIFVADTDNNRIAVINAAGTAVANYAGANAGYVDGAIASAQFNQPQAAFIAGRTVFVADSNNDVVRLIDARASTVSTLIADTGDLVLDAPAGIVVSTDGSSVFIADQNNHRIVLVETGNSLPTISAPATFSLPLNANRSITVTATDTDETGSLSFQVSGGADLLTLTTATNSLMIRSGSDMGSTTLTLHTSDSLGAHTYAELVVTVTAAAVAQPASSGGCSLQSESGAIDWTLWLLALLSLAALCGYRRRVS